MPRSVSCLKWQGSLACSGFCAEGADGQQCPRDLVTSWIAYVEAEEGSLEQQTFWWAAETVMDWSLDGEVAQLWHFILATYRRPLAEEVVAVLAAGPLENLLAQAGEIYIDSVEQLAGNSWQPAMSGLIFSWGEFGATAFPRLFGLGLKQPEERFGRRTSLGDKP